MSTSESVVVEKPKRVKRWWLPQLSLLSFLLLAALVCVSVSHFRLSDENNRLQARNDQLMEQMGYLVIHDPNKVYFRRVQCLDDVTWSFRIYLPPKKEFSLYTKAGNGWSGTGPIRHDDQMTVTVGLRLNAKGKWEIRTTMPKGGMSTSTDAQVAEKLKDYSFPSFLLEDQQELDPDKPFDLLEYSNGDLHIWIEPYTGGPHRYSGAKSRQPSQNAVNQPK